MLPFPERFCHLNLNAANATKSSRPKVMAFSLPVLQNRIFQKKSTQTKTQIRAIEVQTMTLEITYMVCGQRHL